MAQSITDKILAFLKAALVNGAPPESANVVRSRTRPVEPTELPLYNLYPVIEQVDKIGTGIRVAGVKRVLKVAVTIRRTGTDAELDIHRTYVIKAVMADLSIDGLATEIEEVEHDWTIEDASDADYAQDTVIFQVSYQTSQKTPESK
jgi:hypothetical protein